MLLPTELSVQLQNCILKCNFVNYITLNVSKYFLLLKLYIALTALRRIFIRIFTIGLMCGAVGSLYSSCSSACTPIMFFSCYYDKLICILPYCLMFSFASCLSYV